MISDDQRARNVAEIVRAGRVGTVDALDGHLRELADARASRPRLRPSARGTSSRCCARPEFPRPTSDTMLVENPRRILAF